MNEIIEKPHQAFRGLVRETAFSLQLTYLVVL